MNSDRRKLSKQNHAQPISTNNVRQLTVDALRFLGQSIPDNWQDVSQEQLLQWAIDHWQIKDIPKNDKLISSL